jgi:hypothetical protein
MISLANARKILGPKFTLNDSELSELINELIEISQYAIGDHLTGCLSEEEKR